MTKSLMGEADEIASLFKYIREKTETEDYVALGLVTEICKNARVERMQAERQSVTKGGRQQNSANNDAATEKQLAWLADLGVKVEQGISRSEASALIEEAMEKVAAR